jgi:hypothetical protein
VHLVEGREVRIERVQQRRFLLLNTGNGPAFFVEQAFKLNMEWISMRTGALIGTRQYQPLGGTGAP